MRFSKRLAVPSVFLVFLAVIAPWQGSAATYAASPVKVQPAAVAPSQTDPQAQVLPTKKKVRTKPCSSPLAVLLHEVGFRGENLREAWAIVMRESRGIPSAKRAGADFGLFQLNKPTWGSFPWWDDRRVLRAKYNAKRAFILSSGGRNWVAWGLTGHGEANPRVYRSWSAKKVRDNIMRPYKKAYRMFPSSCKRGSFHGARSM